MTKHNILILLAIGFQSAIVIASAAPAPVMLAMSHWRQEDFKAEIQNLEVMESRSRPEGIMDRLYTSFEEKLKGLHGITATFTEDLMQALEDSTLPPARIETLMNILDNVVSSPNALQLKQVPQSVVSLPMWLSNGDWKKLKETTVTRDAMVVLVQRMKKMGILSMKEVCKRQAIAIILVWMNDRGQAMPEPWPLYYLTKDFQTVFGAMKVLCEVPSLETYPFNPLGMPQDYLNKIYGNDDPPACQDLSLALYLDKIPLRKTSNLLKGCQKPQAASSAATAPAVASPQETVPGLDSHIFFLMVGFFYSLISF